MRPSEAATGEVSELELAGLFVYVGLQPNTEIVADQLALDEDGRLPVDGRLRTELPGVFAAGVLRRDAAGPGDRLCRRRRARRQGRRPLPRRGRLGRADPCRGGCGRSGKRRHTWLRS